MRSSKLNNFIPSYPFITDENLNYDLFRKKELYQLKLKKIQDESEKIKGLFKEQEYISRFISSYTPYDGILLVHATGTGKTCAYFGATETIRNQQNYVVFDKAIVLAPTPLILENLKQNLVEKCSTRYEDIGQLNLDPFYSFIAISQPTFIEQLKTKIKGKIPIIIIDEIHRFISDQKEESKFYALMDALHSIPSKKIIAGSATPMVDSYTQIFKVMALLTPFSEKPTKKIIQEFEKKYNSEIIKKDNIIQEIKQPLVKLFKGKISFLRKSIDIKVKNITNPNVKPNLVWIPETDSDWNFQFSKNQLQLLFNEWFICKMEGIQNAYYTKDMIPIYKSGKGIDMSLAKNNLPIQSSLFVFPKLNEISKPLLDQSLYYNPNNKMIIMTNKSLSEPYQKLEKGDIELQYSNLKNKIYTFYSTDEKEGEVKEGWNQYITLDKNKKNFSFKSQIIGYKGNQNSNRLVSIKGSPLKKLLLGKTLEDTLNNIKQYSIIYYNILKSIIEHPKEKHFVYITQVKGSGAFLLALLLNLLKYRRYTKSSGIPQSVRASYIILNSDLTNALTNKRFIEIFNHSSNKYGNYIQVIIGGKAIATGIDLKHIRHIHVATPDWNYTNIKQGIGRGIRSGSHDDLKQEERTVSIYKYVSTPQQVTKMNYIIYARMYIRSFYKDLNIKQIEYFMKINAVNCPIFYKRNYIDGKDFSELCANIKNVSIVVKIFRWTIWTQNSMNIFYRIIRDSTRVMNLLLFLRGNPILSSLYL